MYFYKNKLSILSLSNECLVPNFLKLHDFASLKSKFFWGRTPRPPTSYLAKGQWSLKISLYKNHPPPHTHTHVPNLHLRVKKVVPDVSIKENIVPLNIHRILPMAFFFFFFFFFFLLFDVRPLLLKISGSAHVIE